MMLLSGSLCVSTDVPTGWFLVRNLCCVCLHSDFAKACAQSQRGDLGTKMGRTFDDGGG